MSSISLGGSREGAQCKLARFKSEKVNQVGSGLSGTMKRCFCIVLVVYGVMLSDGQQTMRTDIFSRTTLYNLFRQKNGRLF